MSIGSLSLWWSGKVAENEAAAGVSWRCFSNQWFMEEAGRAVQNEGPHGTRKSQRLVPLPDETRPAGSPGECNQRGFRHCREQLVRSRSFKTHSFRNPLEKQRFFEITLVFGGFNDFSGLFGVRKRRRPNQLPVEAVH